MGYTLPLDAQILDFGCGRGGMVQTYLSQGYQNVYGYDTQDYWNNSIPRKHFLSTPQGLRKHKNKI